MYLVARYHRGIKIASMRLLPTLNAVFQRLEDMRADSYYRSGSLENYIMRGYSYRVYCFEHPEAPPKLVSKKKLLEEYRKL